MKPIPDPEGYIKGFIYKDGNRELAFGPGEVIWFRYPNPADEFRGLSPLAAARVSVEASVDAMKSNGAIFKNGMSPGGILSPSDNQTAFTREERELLEAQLTRRLAGSDRRHRVMVFSHQVNLQTPTMSPKDAEFLGLMGWTLNDICRVYQIPPSKVQDFSRATYSNAEQANKALWTDAILPELAMLASELTEQLAPMFGSDLTVEFDTSGVQALQEDQTEVTDQLQKLAALGVPLNKLLQVYRPELLPDGGTGYAWGDTPIQLALAGLAGPVSPGPSPASPEAPAEEPTASKAVTKANAEGPDVSPFVPSRVPAFASTRHKAEMRSRDRLTRPYEADMARLYLDWSEALTEDLLRRMGAKAKAEGDAIGDIDPEDPFDLDYWQGQAEEAMSPTIREAYRMGGQVNMRRLGAGIRFDITAPDAMAFLSARAQRFARQIAETRWEGLKRSLKAGMEAGEDMLALAGRVQTEIGANPRRAETVARTEVIGAYNGGAEEAFRQSGIVAEKAWLSTLDDRVRETHEAMHGQTVPVGEPFVSPSGATGPTPGSFGVAAEDINCRCTVIAVLGSAAGDREGDLAGVESEAAEEEGF